MRSLVQDIRRFIWRQLQSGDPRGRFLVLRSAIWLGRSIDVNILRDLAGELERAGATEWAKWCWRLLHRLVPFDPEILMGRLTTLMANGEVDRVRFLVEEARRSAGFPPARMVWLAGKLACHGYWLEAGALLQELEKRADGGQRLIQQSPSIISLQVPHKLGCLANELQELAEEAAGDGVPQLKLARLCFTFGNLGVAAELYRQAGAYRPLSWLDQVAMHYAQARAGARVGSGEAGTLARLLEGADEDPDALAMLSYAGLAMGEDALAGAALERAICAKYGGGGRVEAVLEDGRSILRVIASMREVGALLPRELVEPGEAAVTAGVPKVFICGFGWSGSGAVYDDIRGIAGFCEFEGPGHDPILNEDSESEVTFIQSTGGLGDLWRHVNSRRRLEWQRLWDLFSLHVLGVAPIGYSNYKSCAAAANHVRRYGGLYTGPFRDFFLGYAQLRNSPRKGGLFQLLRETTEALCAMLVAQNGGKAVLFNNAVFGRDVEMLEIFRACHAVAVFRDPLDVYADRKDKDKNHWRTPRQLAEFYGRGLQRYLAYRTAAGRRVGATLREVPFERFVRDSAFRWRVRAWLLPGLEDRGHTYFDPVVSSGNIGLHQCNVDAEEARQLQPATAAHQEMERLSRSIWGL